MKNLLLYSLLAVTMLIATALRSAEIIPVWHKVNESGGIHDMEFLKGEDEFIMIAGVGELGEIQVRETLTGELVKSFPLHSLSYDNQIEITPDSTRFVLSTGGDPKLKTSLELRSLEDFHLIKSMYFELGKDTIDDEGNHYHSKLNQLVIDPVRPYVYAIYEKQNRFGNLTPLMLWLKVYNYETMEEVKDLTPVGFEKEQLKCIDVSDDGRYLAALNNGKAYLKVWDLATMELIKDVKLWDNKLPDYDWECQAKDIEFSSINSDLIYFSGYFPHQDEPVDSSGVLKFYISNESVETIKTDYPFAVLGRFILFDNEERVLVYSGSSLKFLNQLQQKLELSVGPTLEYPFYNKTIFTKKYGLFIGYNGEYIGSLKYDSQTGIINTSEKQMIISPNPTTGILNISINNKLPSIFRYDIISDSGQSILSDDIGFLQPNNNNVNINISSVPMGHYLLKITSDREAFTFNIIKE